jgi:hypothetical protein
MNDLHQYLEKLSTDAEDCALISKLATDKQKRELFARMSEHLRVMAADIEQLITDRTAKEKSPR